MGNLRSAAFSLFFSLFNWICVLCSSIAFLNSVIWAVPIVSEVVDSVSTLSLSISLSFFLQSKSTCAHEDSSLTSPKIILNNDSSNGTFYHRTSLSKFNIFSERLQAIKQGDTAGFTSLTLKKKSVTKIHQRNNFQTSKIKPITVRLYLLKMAALSGEMILR